jgi:hypothetical protein
MTEYHIEHLFETLYPFRESLMHNLTATDLATFCYSAKIKLSEQEKTKYLVPIRDLPQQEEWIRNWVKDGNRLTIMGKNIPLWFERIKNPHRYWAEYERHVAVRMWIIVPPAQKDEDERMAEIDTMHADLFTAWQQYKDPDADDIEEWHRFGPFSWPGMSEYHQHMLGHLDQATTTRLSLVKPPGSWGSFFDLEGGYGIPAHQLHDTPLTFGGDNEGWEVLLDDDRNPTEVMYVSRQATESTSLTWIPSHLMDVHEIGVSSTIISLTEGGSETRNISSVRRTIEDAMPDALRYDPALKIAIDNTCLNVFGVSYVPSLTFRI